MIITKEHNYDYRMNQAIKKLLRWNEKSLDDFTNGHELMQFVWANQEALGEIVACDMIDWKADDEWFDEIND